MLKILKLNKRFGGIKAVADCSFAVKPGLITALIGPNGSGKTTVFNLISGLLSPDDGQIVFQNHNIARFNPDRISNFGLSRVFQQSRLFNNLSVKDNLLLAFDNQDVSFWRGLFGSNKVDPGKEHRISELLDLVKFNHCQSKLCRDLSYGQKRLVELVRAIINPHRLLMLDEPLAGVTLVLRREIGVILRQLRQLGETILLIEHDMNFTLSIADEIIVMDAGRVIAQGPPEEIRRNKEVLEAYLGV